MGVFKRNVNGKKSAKWYGKVQVAPGQWRQTVLYADKVASERELKNRQQDADRRAAGVGTVNDEALRSLGVPRRAFFTVFRDRLMPGTGLEPASLAALAPQASASANFATRAECFMIADRGLYPQARRWWRVLWVCLFIWRTR